MLLCSSRKNFHLSAKSVVTFPPSNSLYFTQTLHFCNLIEFNSGGLLSDHISYYIITFSVALAKFKKMTLKNLCQICSETVVCDLDLSKIHLKSLCLQALEI
jgi:hypothetical protein